MNETDRSERREALRRWVSEEYPGFQITEVQLDNYLDAQDRVDGPAERMAELGDVEIVPIGADRIDDMLEFFDRRAFVGNLQWAACYCAAPFVEEARDGRWEDRTWQQNRAHLQQAVGDGTLTGALAYVDGTLAAFLNASRRAVMPELATGDDAGVVVTACFVVAPPYRRHGLARRMLEQALADLQRAGYTTVEGHTTTEPRSGEASLFRGPVELYRSFGFVVEPGEGSEVTVRLRLDRGRPQ